MKSILAAANRNVLEQFAWSNVLLAFDFDGTLAPIVTQPGAAKMRERTRKLVETLCTLYPCAVISGRSVEDVRARMEGMELPFVVGNHGMEPGSNLGAYERITRSMLPSLSAALAEDKGIEIEDKRYSLALHYRKSRAKRSARSLVTRAIAALDVPVRVVPGKQVFNVLPEGAPHKGTALLALRARAHADTAIFVGDDVTDEDVFTIDEPGRLLSIRVGVNKRSAAPYCVESQREIDALLARLVELRRDPAFARRGA
jgi:trehalose 6-phosphate phosphatase